MREAVGGTWIFQIVIFFVLLFTGFICLTINQSKAFNVKDQILQIIQGYNGIDLTKQHEEGGEEAIDEIIKYMQNTAYRNKGRCPSAINVNGSIYEYQGFTKDGKVTSSNAAFCIAKVESSEAIMNSSCGGANCITNELPSISYYRIVVFYQLDLPVFHDLFNFRISGDTKSIFKGSEL